MPTTLSRVFMNGNSQAVRIPKAFRLETSQVQIFRNADGDLVLRQPKARTQKRGDALMNTLAQFDASFSEALLQSQGDQAPMQEREAL